MSFVAKLIGFGFRQVIPDQVIGHYVGKASDAVADVVVKHCTDHSQALPKALARANDRSWQALSIALAGDGLLDRIKVFFASGDDKGIREQVRLFLQDKNMGFQDSSAEFRKKCLDDLKKLKEAGLLKSGKDSVKDIAHQVGSFQLYGDPTGMIDGAEQVVRGIAAELDADYPNLAQLLRQQPSGSPPLLVASFAYFFRREVETNPEVAHGLTFDGLRQLSASQAQAFSEVGKALDSLGVQFEQLLEQLDRIETVVVETHGAVLDLQVELARLGDMNLTNGNEVRRILSEVLNRVSQLGMQKGEVKPHHSLSIRSDDERNAVKQLLAGFRQMPPEQQRRLPALLNGLGKLQIGSGDYEGARQSFVAVSEHVRDAPAQAEVHFNIYRAALEEKKWAEALVAIQQAAALDADRFSLFPMKRFRPQRILGAGGFGTAFLCHESKFEEEVVVKTLQAGDLERSTTDVFREALLLRKLRHPAIIGVRDYEYADPLKQARPFIVMDYFPGESLESLLQKHGVIALDDMIVIARQIAEGLSAAHQQGVWHRDIKPDNILVRKAQAAWTVKIIDFGLALRKQAIETSLEVRSAGNTILSDSVAGTIKYAPPEQMGELKGVKPGPYSDVFAFGKMFCYALFETTEPKRRHWSALPNELHEMLEQCTERELKYRLPSFEPVLKVLELLDPALAQRKKEEESRHKADLEQQRREQEEAGRLRHEQERLQKDGDTKLAELVVAALNRTQGKPAQDDTAANELIKKHRIPAERAKRIVDEVKQQWAQDHPAKKEPTAGEIITNSLGMKFVYIPPGAFMMGSPKDEADRRDTETQHRVTISKGYYLGVFPVTRGEFAQFVKDSRYKTQAEAEGGAYGWTGKEFKVDPKFNWRQPGFDQSDAHPVVCISWNDATEYCQWLCKKEKQTYRLPTEAEWEYACRAGTTTPYCFGKTITKKQANFNNEIRGTSIAGSYPPNAWGLYDMHGNVWEWCADWWGEYPEGDTVDATGPENGSSRVLRGGSFNFRASVVRSASRFGSLPTDRNYSYGFRLARTFTA